MIRWTPTVFLTLLVLAVTALWKESYRTRRPPAETPAWRFPVEPVRCRRQPPAALRTVHSTENDTSILVGTDQGWLHLAYQTPLDPSKAQPTGSESPPWVVQWARYLVPSTLPDGGWPAAGPQSSGPQSAVPVGWHGRARAVAAPPPSRVFRVISIPFWVLLAATLLPAIPVLIRGPLRWRYRCHMGHCPRCGYDLSSLPDARCPECGRRFDPSRQQNHRARWIRGAANANERLRRYDASRWRRIAVVLCLVTAIGAALTWLLGAWRFTYRTTAFSGYVARGHAILIFYPIELPTLPVDPIARRAPRRQAGPPASSRVSIPSGAPIPCSTKTRSTYRPGPRCWRRRYSGRQSTARSTGSAGEACAKGFRTGTGACPVGRASLTGPVLPWPRAYDPPGSLPPV